MKAGEYGRKQTDSLPVRSNVRTDNIVGMTRWIGVRDIFVVKFYVEYYSKLRYNIKERWRFNMPNIKPISDLRNYRIFVSMKKQELR